MHRRVRTWGAVIVVAVLAASCSRAVDVDSVQTSSAKNPQWVTDAYALARKVRGPSTIEEIPLDDSPSTTVATSTSLPPKDQFVAALSAAGLDPTAAGCIYDGISGTPLGESVGKVLAAATDPLTASSAASGIDETTQRQLLVALAPCLDTKTLLSVLAAVSGGSGLSGLSGLAGLAGASGTSGAAGASGMQALLGAVAKQAGSLPSGVDPAALAKAAGLNLTPQQIQALTAAVTAAQQAAAVDTSKIDFSKIDVTKLSQAQLVTLFTALLKGLTPTQLVQLNQVASVDLQQLNLNIDPSKLNHDELGSLFVLLLPFIAAGISSPSTQAPAGVDPTQIYIPPGTDLSAINPLNFIPQQTLIAGLQQQYGLTASVSSCLYQKVRVIDPRLLGAAYAGTNEVGAAQLLLAILSCVSGG